MTDSRIDAARGPNLQLLLPGLFGRPAPEPQAVGAPELPALETLLARATPRALSGRGFESLLFSLFGAEPPADADLPVGAVTRVLDLGVVDDGWWLRADPIHLSPRRDQLILTDSYMLDLTQNEASRLAAEITEAYTPEGWIIKAPRPSRWYLKPARTPKVSTTPLAEVVGRDIHPYLPRGLEAKAWHTILNETQILLHTSKVNEEREAAGKLPVNSLWFWGGGRLPRIQPVRWGGLWSGEPVSLGLARLSETPSHSAPADFNEWHRLVEADGAHLVVLDALRAPALYRDDAAWGEAIQELERRWFAPLLEALKQRGLESASLLTDSGQSFELTAGQARRWWRFKKPLATHDPSRA
jgi:hypothetical protein